MSRNPSKDAPRSISTIRASPSTVKEVCESDPGPPGRRVRSCVGLHFVDVVGHRGVAFGEVTRHHPPGEIVLWECGNRRLA